MNKKAAIDLFGSVQGLADALGITRQAIYKWPDELPQRTADEVLGAAVRVGHLALVGEGEDRAMEVAA